jgi:hypothetical protein
MKDPMELLDKHFDGLLSEAEAVELCRWVKEDPRHARLVTRAAMIHQRLRQVMRGRQLLEETASLNDAMIMPAITLETETETETLPQAPEVMRIAAPAPSRRRYGRLAAMIALPILVGIALWSILRPAIPTSKLVNSAAANWEDAAHAPHDGQMLPAGPLRLTSGLAHVRLDNGVSLVVEGPARFEIQSQSTVAMNLGKITVSVPPNAHGFTVLTPSARAVDLGTEFGVSVDSSGNTETHVIRGIVEMTPIAGGGATRLTADNAARVDIGAKETQKIECLTGNFVQDIPAIDLTDIVAGGDGTQHLRNSGIDVADGSTPLAGADMHAAEDLAGRRKVQGDGRFHPCPSRPLIGGVFIPHGGSTPDTIDPAGHQFNFPLTENQTFLDLWAGSFWKPARTGHVPSGVMGSTDYAGSGHGLLLLHANKGIAFNLDALRDAHPDRPFSHFQAACANLTSGDPPLGVVSDRSELWVFVDGDLRSHKLIHRTDPPFEVDVPIESAAHYLTLVGTDGGDKFDWDWVTLGDPRLK